MRSRNSRTNGSGANRSRRSRSGKIRCRGRHSGPEQAQLAGQAHRYSRDTDTDSTGASLTTTGVPSGALSKKMSAIPEAGECSRARRHRAAHNLDAWRSRPGRTSRRACGRRRNASREDGDPSRNRHSISRRCRNRPHNPRSGSRCGPCLSKRHCNCRAASKTRVCRSRPSIRRRAVCPCKNRRAVRRC